MSIWENETDDFVSWHSSQVWMCCLSARELEGNRWSSIAFLGCVLVLQASSHFTHTVNPFIDWAVVLSIRIDLYSACARQATEWCRWSQLSQWNSTLSCSALFCTLTDVYWQREDHFSPKSLVQFTCGLPVIYWICHYYMESSTVIGLFRPLNCFYTEIRELRSVNCESKYYTDVFTWPTSSYHFMLYVNLWQMKGVQ
jgi:hypothetical protein